MLAEPLVSLKKNYPAYKLEFLALKLISFKNTCMGEILMCILTTIP